MRRSRNILSAAGDALLRTLLLYGNGTDDLYSVLRTVKYA
jgi:hypothetical protein